MEQVEITVPETWSDVTVGTFKEIDFSSTLQTIATLTGLPEDNVSRLSNASLDEMLMLLDFLYQNPVMRFETTYNGYEIVDDLNDLTLGDLETLENLCQDFVKNATQICAFVYGKNEKLDLRSVESRSTDFEDMPMDVYWGFVFQHIVTAGLLLEPDLINKITTPDGQKNNS